MDIKNVVLSAQYLDFINNLDNLIFKLLYSNDGYTAVLSKDAVLKFDEYLEKFKYEAQKIRQKYSFNDADFVIKEKEKIFISFLEKHYNKQVFFWVDDVYQDFIDNCLFLVSTKNENKSLLLKTSRQMIEAVNWVSKIKNLSKEEKLSMIEKLRSDFNKAVNSKDSDYMEQKSPEKSDIKLFLKLFKMLKDDKDLFSKLDLNAYKLNLSQVDLKLFTNFQQSLLSYKKTSLSDEISLIDSAINIKEINNDNDIYNFIKDIYNDFSFQISLNKTALSEDEKIKIVKRRMELFDKKSKNSGDYFKKMLISSCR